MQEGGKESDAMSGVRKDKAYTCKKCGHTGRGDEFHTVGICLRCRERYVVSQFRSYAIFDPHHYVSDDRFYMNWADLRGRRSKEGSYRGREL